MEEEAQLLDLVPVQGEEEGKYDVQGEQVLVMEAQALVSPPTSQVDVDALIMEEDEQQQAAVQEVLMPQNDALDAEEPIDIDFDLDHGTKEPAVSGTKRSRDDFEGEGHHHQEALHDDLIDSPAAEDQPQGEHNPSLNDDDVALTLTAHDNHQNNNNDIAALLEGSDEPPIDETLALIEEDLASAGEHPRQQAAEPLHDLDQEEAILMAQAASSPLTSLLDDEATHAALPPSKRLKTSTSQATLQQPWMASPSSILDLPPEIMLKIYVYLGFVDLANCTLVCHQWKSIASDDVLWKRLYYEVWGTNAKTWKQLFASHYPEHEEMDMQNLIREMTRAVYNSNRRHIMGLYRLDKSYTGTEFLPYPKLYRDVWSLSSQEIKSIVANEVELTARNSNPHDIELGVTMQQWALGWKEINNYDRAQNIVWEMLRYEGEGDRKTWMEEDEASNYTEWLFGYFPYRRLTPEQLQKIKAREGKQIEAAEAALEAEASESDEPPYVANAGQIVGVGRIIEHADEEEDEIDEEVEEAPPTTTTSTTSTDQSVREKQAANDDTPVESAGGEVAQTMRRPNAVPNASATPTDSAGTKADSSLRGRSQVARFFHTGPIKRPGDLTFAYGFAAISSSRFCTYWIETDEEDIAASL